MKEVVSLLQAPASHPTRGGELYASRVHRMVGWWGTSDKLHRFPSLTILPDTKERPFKCMKCRSTFVRRDLLLRHDRTVHAKDGGVRWTQDMGGRVIGSVVVIGETVYVAEFDDTNIYGFRLRDGKKKFGYHTGAYMPGITDGRRFYLVGYSSIHALDPVKKNRQGQGGGGGHGGDRSPSCISKSRYLLAYIFSSYGCAMLAP